MTINVSHFRQEVSKVRLSKDAFAELLTIRELFETVSQGVRFDTKVAYINPLQSSVLREELNRIRNMIDHESHVLILEGFKVDKRFNVQISGVDIRFLTRCPNGTESSWS